MISLTKMFNSDRPQNIKKKQAKYDNENNGKAMMTKMTMTNYNHNISNISTLPDAADPVSVRRRPACAHLYPVTRTCTATVTHTTRNGTRRTSRDVAQHMPCPDWRIGEFPST